MNIYMYTSLIRLSVLPKKGIRYKTAMLVLYWKVDSKKLTLFPEDARIFT